MENLMYKDWKAENEAKIGMRFGEVKSSGLEHVELPLELSSGSTTTRKSSLVNGGEEAKDVEEEEEEVQQVSERAPTLPSCTMSAPRIRVTPQQRQGLHVPAAEEEGRGKRRTQAPNRLTYEALGKPAKSALAGAALIVGDEEESDYDECAFVFFSPVEMPGEPPIVTIILSHQTLLWHHHLGHPSLPRLRGMHSRLLVSGLPTSLPPLPPSLALPCLPCVKGWQRAAPHSSSFPPTTAPLQTLHMDVFPLCSKGQVVDVLVPWIRTVRVQPHDRFGHDLLVLRLHSDRGGEFSSNLLRDFCQWEGILQSFTLPESPKQNGIAERCIGLVMEVAHTSMIHAAAPHFLWPFAVQYAAHQLNLWPRVSLPETSPTLRWTGEVGDASVFWVWGSRAFVRDTSADKLSPCAIPCVFLGSFPDALGWQFYHLTSHCVFPSMDVTFDESVPFFHIVPYRSTPPPPPPLFLAPGPPLVVVDSGAAGGVASGGAASEGAETRGAEPGGVQTGGDEPGGAEPEGVEPGGAASEGAESGDCLHSSCMSGLFGAHAFQVKLPELEVLELLELEVLGVAAGAGVTGGTSTTGPGGARTQDTGAAESGGVEVAGAGDPTESGATGASGSGAGGAGAGGAGVGGTGAGGTGVGGLGVGRAGAGGAGAVDPGGAVRSRLYFVPILQQLASPLPAPSPYTEQSGSLTQRRALASHPVSPVRIARRVPRSRPPPVLGTHAMTLRPSSVPFRVPLPAPSESSLPEVPDLEPDRAPAATPTVSRLLATAVTDPSFESAAASALVAKLLDVAAACRLDYATALVAKSASASPLSVEGECALGMDVLEDRQEDFECLAAAVPRFASMLLAPEEDPDAPNIPTPHSYAEAITGPYSSQWQAAMDAEMAFWKSTGTYVDEVPPPGANLVDGMWIFRVKRPSGSPPVFKARYVARCFTPPSDESIEPSSPYLELVGCLMYLMTCTRPDLAYPLSLLARYVAPGRHRKVHWDAAKRVLHDLCSTSGMGLVLGGRGSAVLTGHADASLVDNSATQRSSQGYTFSLGSGSISWQSTRSSSVLSSCCEAEIYAGAMAAQELRWLTYLLTDLGEQPRSPPILYVDNKAMIALCQEHRLEHRTKHIALRYFLARELQQRGQLRLAYMATRANTADIFTKALPPAEPSPSARQVHLLIRIAGTCIVQGVIRNPTRPRGVNHRIPSNCPLTDIIDLDELQGRLPLVDAPFGPWDALNLMEPTDGPQVDDSKPVLEARRAATPSNTVQSTTDSVTMNLYTPYGEMLVVGAAPCPALPCPALPCTDTLPCPTHFRGLLSHVPCCPTCSALPHVVALLCPTCPAAPRASAACCPARFRGLLPRALPRPAAPRASAPYAQLPRAPPTHAQLLHASLPRTTLRRPSCCPTSRRCPVRCCHLLPPARSTLLPAHSPMQPTHCPAVCVQSSASCSRPTTARAPLTAAHAPPFAACAPPFAARAPLPQLHLPPLPLQSLHLPPPLLPQPHTPPLQLQLLRLPQ
ncbi:unnamed protein product [Closterium sp. NIES-54]